MYVWPRVAKTGKSAQDSSAIDIRRAGAISLLQSAFTGQALRKLCRIGPTLIETLKKAETFFAEKGIPSPRLEAQLIFAHFLKLRRIDLFTQVERPIDKSELELLRQAMREKIAGKPTAYILGTKEFYGREFSVGPAVLIPRPETEELVELILKETKLAPQESTGLPGRETENARIGHVADFGAGSGCIGVTLALELKAARLSLVDISPGALEVAGQNTRRHIADPAMEFHSLAMDFRSKDFALHIPADLIVSNPPYVLPEEFAGLDNAVRDHEPKVALVAEDFEELHRGLLAAVFTNLVAGGFFGIETHPAKSADVAAWATGQGFVGVKICNDFAGRPHFILGRKAS